MTPLDGSLNLADIAQRLKNSLEYQARGRDPGDSLWFGVYETVTHLYRDIWIRGGL